MLSQVLWIRSPGAAWLGCFSAWSPESQDQSPAMSFGGSALGSTLQLIPVVGGFQFSFRTEVSVSLPAVSQRGRSQLLGSPGPRLVMAFRMCQVLLSALTSHFMPTSPLLSSSPLHLSSSRWRSACAFKGSGHWIGVTWKIQQPLPAVRL